MGRKKNSERYKILEVKNPGGTISWSVRGTTASGKRIREQFSSNPEATQRRLDLQHEDEGIVAESKLKRTSLSDAQIRDAETAYALEKSRKLSTLIKTYQDLERRASEFHLTPSEAMAQFERNYSPELDELSLPAATERFLNSRKDQRSKTKSTYNTALNLLLDEVDPNTPVNQVTINTLDKILDEYPNANSRKTYKRSWHTFFEWCYNRKHVLENPVKRMDRILPDQSEIKVLSLKEVQRLLTAAIQLKNGRFAPVIAIGIFAGLRPSEIEEMEPKNILEQEILVKGGKLRRTHKRKVPIPGVLHAWLKEFPFRSYPKGMQRNLRHLKTASKATKWVQDIIRHTSITYQLERDKDEALVTHNNGTSKQMLDQHYRQVIEQSKDVEEFWKLTPKEVKKLSLKVKLPVTLEPTDWPTKRRLETLIKQKPVTQIAKELGVSDVAVRKHCKKLDLELPARGDWQKKRARS